MEELLELKQLLLQGDIKGSLALVEDLEEMGRKAIIDKIRSYAIILLLYLIKQKAEKRTTKSWDVSIRNSIRKFINTNKRRKAGSYYVPAEELKEILVAAYPNALDLASLEVALGSYEPEGLATMVNQDEVIDFALSQIAN